MPIIDETDYDYGEWDGIAQRTQRYERPISLQPSFTFVDLDPLELRVSQENARTAWVLFRAEIERQINDYFSPQPDNEEIKGLALWEKLSPILILYGVPDSK